MGTRRPLIFQMVHDPTALEPGVDFSEQPDVVACQDGKWCGGPTVVSNWLKLVDKQIGDVLNANIYSTVKFRRHVLNYQEPKSGKIEHKSVSPNSSSPLSKALSKSKPHPGPTRFFGPSNVAQKSILRATWQMLFKGFPDECNSLKSLRDGALEIGSSARRAKEFTSYFWERQVISFHGGNGFL